MSQDLCRCGSISFLVYLLVILFGISSWVDINGLWVELPILVQNLPEGWDLPSYMAVIIQIANVAPLVYTISSAVWPHRVLEIPVIYVIISVGGVSCLLLAFLWNVTSEIAGTEHSTALFVLQFCLALVDCTSSVAFLPFMSIFKPQYMTAYFIGEGFSGLVPSLVALGQGAGSMKCTKFPNSFANETTFSNDTSLANGTNYLLTDFTTEAPSFSVFPVYQQPRFGVRTFFLFLMGMMILSGVSFTLLNYWSYCKREQVKISSSSTKSIHEDLQVFTPIATSEDPDDIEHLYNRDIFKLKDKGDAGVPRPIFKQNRSLRKETSNTHSTPRYLVRYSDDSTPSDLSVSIELKSNEKTMSKSKYILFLFLTAYLNALSNGHLPSIQTYSCLPYGIYPYHLSVTLSSIANPVACFASFFLKMTSVSFTLVMTCIGTVLSSYVIWTAATSPDPPLADYFSGAFILVLCWVLLVFTLTYTKVSIATEFRSQGKRALLWIGASQQAGSLAGALVTFFLINNAKVFQVGNPC